MVASPVSVTASPQSSSTAPPPTAPGADQAPSTRAGPVGTKRETPAISMSSTRAASSATSANSSGADPSAATAVATVRRASCSRSSARRRSWARCASVTSRVSTRTWPMTPSGPRSGSMRDSNQWGPPGVTSGYTIIPGRPVSSTLWRVAIHPSGAGISSISGTERPMRYSAVRPVARVRAPLT